ncbi:hypothetical protein TNIN_170771, partial [Trichonephila inaurata madagascariensis]
IEGSWSGIKRFFGNTTHRTEDMFDSYLHEFMWRRKNSHSVENEVFKTFLADVASVFPPLRQDVPPEQEIPHDVRPGHPLLKHSFKKHNSRGKSNRGGRKPGRGRMLTDIPEKEGIKKYHAIKIAKKTCL